MKLESYPVQNDEERDFLWTNTQGERVGEVFLKDGHLDFWGRTHRIVIENIGTVDERITIQNVQDLLRD